MNCRLYHGHLSGTKLLVKPAGMLISAGFFIKYKRYLI